MPTGWGCRSARWMSSLARAVESVTQSSHALHTLHPARRRPRHPVHPHWQPRPVLRLRQAGHAAMRCTQQAPQRHLRQAPVQRLRHRGGPGSPPVPRARCCRAAPSSGAWVRAVRAWPLENVTESTFREDLAAAVQVAARQLWKRRSCLVNMQPLPAELLTRTGRIFVAFAAPVEAPNWPAGHKRRVEKLCAPIKVVGQVRDPSSDRLRHRQPDASGVRRKVVIFLGGERFPFGCMAVPRRPIPFDVQQVRHEHAPLEPSIPGCLLEVGQQRLQPIPWHGLWCREFVEHGPIGDFEVVCGQFDVPDRWMVNEIARSNAPCELVYTPPVIPSRGDAGLAAR